MRMMPTAILAGAALLASTAFTIAQEKSGPDKSGPGAPGGGAERAAPPSKAPASERDRGPRTTAPAQKEPGRSAEPRERSKERPAAQAPDRDKKAGQSDRDRKKAEPRQEKRATERDKDEQEKQPGATGRQQQPDSPKKAEGGRDRRQAQRHEEVRSARMRLSNEQRSDLRAKFDTRSARVGNVKFTARVGTHIPRRVRLFAIPAAVVAIVPAYSYYRYVVVDDYVCIVDPDTYEIVDVIEERAQIATRPERIELRLSAQQRALVLDVIGPDYPPANVRIRLALGAEIPRAVELHTFPMPVIDSIPDLRNFRFVVAERDVVIVDPRDRGVALVIER